MGFALHETVYRGSLHASGGALQCVRHHCRELTCYYRRVTLYCQGITLLRDFQLTGKVYSFASPSLVFNLAQEFVFSRVELLLFPINYLGILDASVPPWRRGTLGKATSKEVNKQVTEQSRQVEEAEGRLHNSDTHNKADMSKQWRGQKSSKERTKQGKNGETEPEQGR